MFIGYMRKVIFPLVGIVAIGWLLIIIGFGIETNDFADIFPATGSIRYSWWMVILLTPFMLITAVVHAAIDNNRLIMNSIGAITTLLSALFLTALGFLLSYYGILVQTFNTASISPPAAFNLQFSGAIIAGLFWVAVTCISHFYEREDDHGHR